MKVLLDTCVWGGALEVILSAGAIVTVLPGRVRIRPPPDEVGRKAVDRSAALR